MQIRKKDLQLNGKLYKFDSTFTTIQRTKLLIKLQTTLTPSLHFVLIGIGGLQSTPSLFDALLEYERTHKTYSQKESLSSLDFDGSNSIHEDEGSLVNSFFSFNCLFQSQVI